MKTYVILGMLAALLVVTACTTPTDDTREARDVSNNTTNNTTARDTTNSEIDYAEIEDGQVEEIDIEDGLY